MKKNAFVISAFPGTGKTYCFNNIKNLTILDSDSSKFNKAFFPENYIQHIKENLQSADIIFVSSHKQVRDALCESGIEFTLVYPNISLKEDYIKRYEDRGSPKSFIDLLEKNWDTWITEIMIEVETDKYNAIELEKSETLMDII